MIRFFENFKIVTVGLLVVFGFYFMFEAPIFFNEVKADTATTSLVVGNSAPTVTNVSLNSLADISLVENLATTVVATCTVSDSNTYTDITDVYGRLYRSGVTSTENCTTDANNCTATTTCATSSCASNSCIATCNFTVWFIAEPTDTGSDWDAQHWVTWIKAVDSAASSSTATNSSQTTEVESLNALDITDAIDYGSLAAGETVNPLSKLVKATTTGNAAIDANISGYDMCTDYATCTAATTSITYQHYATSGLNYASTSDGVVVASTSVQLLEFLSTKPTATPSNQAQDVYWGTYVPVGQTVGNYTGVNTFAVQSD